MFGKNKKEDFKETQSSGILEMVKSLSQEELEQLRSILTGAGDDNVESGGDKEPIKEQSTSLEQEPKQEDLQNEESGNQAQGDDLEASQDQIEPSVEQDTQNDDESIQGEMDSDDVADEVTDTPLTEKEEALLAENAALREEITQMREQLKQTALDTPKFRPQGSKDGQGVIHRPISYEEQSNKYFSTKK